MSDDVFVELYVVIYEDRHIGVEVEVFSTLDKANKVAEAWVHRAAAHPHNIDWNYEINEPQEGAGVVRHIPYSCESDSVTIIRRHLDEEA